MFDTTTTRAALLAAALAVALPGAAYAADDDDPIDDEGQVVIEGDSEPGMAGSARPTDDDRDVEVDPADRQGMQNRQAQRTEMNQSDLQKWFEYTASANQYEVEASKLAQEKLDDAEIKQLARTVEQDHSQALDTLRQEAQDAGIEIAQQPELMPVHQAALNALEQKQGEDFKKAYVFSQDSGHRLAILEHSWAKDHVSNPQVQSYVSAVLPKLQAHHEKVHEDARMLANLDEQYRQQLNGQPQLAGQRDGQQGQMGQDQQLSADPAERYYQERARNLRYEQELGRLAGERGENPRIQEYGQRQQERAQQEYGELERDAQEAGFDVGQDSMSRSQQARIDEMGRMGGEDFDREYVFESTRQSFTQGMQDQMAGRDPRMGQSPAGQQAMQSVQRSMQSNQQRQQELQGLLILIIDPAQQQGGQPGQPGMGGQQPGQGGQPGQPGQPGGMNDR